MSANISACDTARAREQEANWCVTRPWFDDHDPLGTRKRFVGTEEEVSVRSRAGKRRNAPAARQSDTTEPVEA